MFLNTLTEVILTIAILSLIKSELDLPVHGDMFTYIVGHQRTMDMFMGVVIVIGNNVKKFTKGAIKAPLVNYQKRRRKP